MAGQCHDRDPSTQGTRAWCVGREDTTPLSCRTGTQPHTASPAHVGLRIADKTGQRPRAQTLAWRLRREGVGGETSFVLVREVLGQGPNRRPPPTPCHFPECDSFQTGREVTAQPRPPTSNSLDQNSYDKDPTQNAQGNRR